MDDEANARVRALLEQVVASGDELGLQVADAPSAYGRLLAPDLSFLGIVIRWPRPA